MIRRLRPGSVVESTARRALVPEPVCEPADSPAMPPVMADEDATAFRHGYADGFEAGEQDAAQEYAQRKAELEIQAEEAMRIQLRNWEAGQARLEQLVQGLVQAVQAHERAMLELSFELAAATLQQVFSSDDAERSLIARLCQRMAQERRVQDARIEVSTADRTLLPESIEGLPIVESVTLDAGQCRLVGEYGASESSVASRLAAIFEAMHEALGHRQA